MKTGLLAIGFIFLSGASMAEEKWRNFNKEEALARLEPMERDVTQKGGTEAPFQNRYWNLKEAGIYVDVVSGEPLFSSLDKFDSGTGWPSFTRPLESANVTTRADRKLIYLRTEVRSRHADSHLGHLFDDGPAPTGKRYCINSAALRFVPLGRLEGEGYGEYRGLFEGRSGSPVRPAADTHRVETAILAGGCFWGVEELIRKIPGVTDVEAGYTGGALENPTYADVKTGKTGHAEAVRVRFDPAQVGYAALLEHFFRLHDPTTKNRQGNDVGAQYRSAIFYLDEEQKKAAGEAKAEARRMWKKEVVTEILPAGSFYPAEEDHQDYLAKNPGGYSCHYYRTFR